MSTHTFQQVGMEWLEKLPTVVRRNGRPVSANTARIYRFNLRRLVGKLGSEMLPITNKKLQEYVAWMRSEGYSDAQIVSDLNTFTVAVESLRNDDGDSIFPVKINHDFVGTPILDPKTQRGECATSEQIERAVRLPSTLAGLVAIAAGGGLRISEILALEYGDNRANDSWEPMTATLHIRRTLKTLAAKRDVPITRELNDFLIAQFCDLDRGKLFDVSLCRIYQLLSKNDLPPVHSYRRFYITWHDRQHMNDEVSKRISGHSKGGDVHARYKFTDSDAEFARAEVERCGLGFSLPVEVK